MEAAIGIEPMSKGFADPRLTTWLRRRNGIIAKGLAGDATRTVEESGRVKRL